MYEKRSNYVHWIGVWMKATVRALGYIALAIALESVA